MTARVYTIPPGIAFTDALARGLLNQYQNNTLPLSQLEIYLPNRRSCRTVSDSFLKLTDGSVTILPRLTPIGDIDQDELLLSDMAPDLSVRDPIQPMARQFLLAQLIMARGDMDLSYDQALRLALDLGKLIDQIHTYDLSFDQIDQLVPEEFAKHWQVTIDFLAIVIKALPDILKEKNLANPSEYRDELLRLKSKAFNTTPPDHPIIAAGITGTIPTTTEFIASIAHLPNGCVILPGLDKNLDEESWAIIDESHPQYNLKNLLEVIGITRDDVQIWPELKVDKKATPKTKRIIQERDILASEMARPANTTQKWSNLTLNEICIDGITQIDAETPQEESQTIALMMREVLETPQKTATLITPDRNLAKRVSADLKRWQIDIDDSAGVPLSQTSLGHFLILCATMMDKDYSTITLLELLKHPLCHLGYECNEYTFLIKDFEKDIIRGPKLQNFSAIQTKINALEDEEKRIALTAFSTKISDAFSVLWEIDTTNMGDWVKAHITLTQKLTDEDSLWVGDDGKAAATLFSDLNNTIEWQPVMSADDYTQITTTLMEQVTIRPRFQRHPRLKILSPIEGRLQSADLIILAGLNEGTWPMGSANDPWMSRPMRKEFGLPGLERSIGLAAHDFCQHLCSPNVVLSRSKMNDGAQTVPSRWLLRLKTVLKQSGIKIDFSGAYPYQFLAQNIDQTDEVKSCPQPAPTPPVHLRPRKLSATAIETWIRDPYSIYARHILKLKKLSAIEEDEDYRDWGTYVHHVLEIFTNQKQNIYDDNALKILIKIADQQLKNKTLRPDQEKQWQLKFKNIAAWFIDFERQNSTIQKRLGERSGLIKIKNDNKPFTLTGRVDRLDITDEGGVHIIDYKTGSVPPGTDVRKGYSPQLPLMGLMAREGGFKEAEKHKIEALTYYKISGKLGKPADVSPALKREKITIETVIHESEQRLRDLINAFNQLDTPYWSIPNFNAKPKYNDYEHLARVQEWSAGDNDDGGGE